MRSNEERHHVDDERSLNGSKCIRDVPPRLRKNKRLEQRWGQQYYAAVKDAVFSMRINPHMPVELPLSILEETDDCQPMYVCQQCRDCFRFPSSFEAHNSRRSWILGYWCHHCFFIDCSHTQKGDPPCSDCQEINRERTLFLRAKGLRKGRKMGCMKIFYNQCQFFKHLRGHNTTIVDMADVMLMPLPVDIDEESYAELEHLCEIIMERMFLTRTHILDWLRSQQLGNKWWSVLQSNLKNNEGPLAELLAGGSRGGKKWAKPTAKPQKIINNGRASPAATSPGSFSVTQSSSSNTPSSISETIESVIAQSTQDETTHPNEAKNPEMPPLTSITYIDPLEPIEDDDNPCTTADIAFVDCGPAAKTYPPDVAIVLPAKDKLSIIPNGGTGCESVVDITPVKGDSHPPMRMSKPIILKQRSADKGLSNTSTSAASPASQRPFEPKISVKKFAHERLKSSPVVTSCQNSYSRVNNHVPQALRKLAPAIRKARVPIGKAPRPSFMGIATGLESTKKPGAKALPTLAPKILTVHSPKSAQLSKIISQLPPDTINGKKIVFIGQDTDRFTILPNKNDAVPSNLGMIKIPSETEKPKIVQAHLAKMTPIVVTNTGSEQSLRLASETTQKSPVLEKQKPKVQQVFLDGKVIYQNGKKFIIRQARKPITESTVCTSISSLRLQTIPKRVSLSSFLSKATPSATAYVPIAAKPVDPSTIKRVPPSTPAALTSSSPSPSPSSSPSPSLSPSLSTPEDPIGLESRVQVKRIRNDSENAEKSASFSCSSESRSLTAICGPPARDMHSFAVEYFSIEKTAAGKSYVDLSKGKKLSCTQHGANHKKQMPYNYRDLGAERIKRQIEHVKKINAEYSKMLGVINDARISDNLKIIKELENALEEEPLCLDEDQRIDRVSGNDDINEILLNLTESTQTPFTCSSCNRSFNSDSNVIESSRESNESQTCRSCNNFVCHVCDMFQGNLSRFRAHLNYHAKKEPFTCSECFRKFPTFDKLETHTWTTCFSLMARRWFKCRVCQVEGFPSMESVTEHFILAHSRLKIACSECGILSDSRASFQKHIEEDHAKATTQLKPVNLILCDVGNCVVSLEKYRPHMDHHTAILSMLYYKCTFCPFIIQAMKQSREQIRSHLYKQHIDKLYELGFENLDSLNNRRSPTSENNSHDDCNPKTHDISTSSLQSEKNDQTKDMESEQGSNVSQSLDKDASIITLDDSANDPQTDIQLSDYLNGKLTEQTLKDGVECSVWSINLDNTESSESMDLGPGSLEMITTVQEAGSTTNNVISEYSSSPKIFDVRSVTPDSYAELGGVTKESQDHIEGPQSVTKDSLFITMGEQSLPMKLPQVIVINDAETDVNLSEMFQSSWTGPNTFVKLSDLTKSNEKAVTSNIVELDTEVTDKCTDVPGTKEPVIKTVYTLARPGAEKFEKITIGSTTVRKCPVPVSGRKQTLPVSLLKSKNSSIQIIRTNTTESNSPVSDPFAEIADGSQVTTNTLGPCEEKSKGLLLCEIPKPPPLSRIPQRVLDESRVEDEVEEEEVQEVKEITTSPKSMVKSKQRQKRPWRIALNGPISSSELINYHCHLCGELINTSWSVLRNHFSSKHSQDYKLAVVTPRLLRMSSEFISEGYKEVLGCKKRRSDGSISSSKRRRRWNPKKHVEKHPLDLGLCVQQESIQDGEGNFVCKKCDQQCDDISSLRTHIGTNHRIKDHYLVCLECGQNFVVEPSLQMHLKAFHSIQDPCTYLAQNTAYAKKITDTMEDEANTGIANQCHVCMAVFEDKLAVDKHLRVHGMAFLNRKRIEAQNAARNPEKKIKVDKPDIGSPEKSEKLENLKPGNTESVNGEIRES